MTSTTTTSPSNISTQCVEVKEIVKNGGTNGGNTSSSGEPFVKVCVTTDTSLDGGKKMIEKFNGGGNGVALISAAAVDDENAIKRSMDIFIPTIDHEFSELKGTCSEKPCDKNPPSDKNWIWKTSHNGNAGLKNEYKDKVGIPPRTQVLCFGNLHGMSCENDVVSKVTTNETLLTEWIIAAKIEGENLKNQHNNNDKLCKALGYSYADYGDLIKNTSIWENKWTQKLETNLKTMFGKVFENNIQQNGQTSESKKYQDLTLLREVWWNTNKEYIWKAMVTGAELGSANKCSGIDKDTPPTIDHIPQFLRFIHEWVDNYCEKRKDLADKVKTACKTCVDEAKKYHETHNVDTTSGTGTSGVPSKNCDNTTNGGKSDPACKDCKNSACTQCKNACDAYTQFVSSTGGAKGSGATNDWRKQWKDMETKYTKLMSEAREKIKEYHEEQQKKASQGSTSGSSDNIPPFMMKCGKNNDELCVKPDIDSFFQYLHDKGITTLSSYINMVSTTTCGEDNAKWNKTTRDSSGGSSSSGTDTKVFYPEPLGSHPTGYKYACECKIPSREELCNDNELYRNRWTCSTSAASATSDKTRTRRAASATSTNYELCTDKTAPKNTEANHVQIPGATLSDEDAEFFISFDQWYKDIQIKLDEYMKRITDECDQDKIMKKPQNGGTATSGQSSSSGNVSPECSECRDSCECYKLWVNKINSQWDKQQTNYNKFVDKQKKQKNSGQPSGGSHKDDVVDMNSLLFVWCWEDFLEKTHGGKTIDTLDPTADGEMVDVLMKRCGDNKEKDKATDKFKERIDKAEKQKDICNKKQKRCQKDGETPDCDKIGGSDGGNVGGCNDKYYDDDDTNGTKKKPWDCTGKNKNKDVCVPPRTQTLCVANMHGQNDFKKIQKGEGEKLKKFIQNAMKKETENLYKYYTSDDDKKRAIISKKSGDQKGQTDASGLPHNFCKAAERTYNDFKHMVLGDSISKHTIIGDIGKKIKTVLQNDKSGTTPQDWWDKYSDHFWDAIKCGFKDKQKPNNSSEKFSGNECGVFYPPESDTDSQFVWWFKEWGQQFCFERQKYIDGINDKCSWSSHNRCDKKDGIPDKLKDDCQQKCTAYKNFINDKRTQWKQQKDKYVREHPGENIYDLFGDFPECKDANFDLIFRDTTTSGTTGPSGKPNSSDATKYGDASDICSCKDQIYNASGTHPSGCHEKSNDTAWSSSRVKNGTNGQRLRGVFAPPRRQKLCLANLYPINFGNDTTTGNSTTLKKNTLENRVKIIAEREAYFLWLKYNKKENPNNPESNKKACCDIRRSFFDIGDIVKGTDLWHDIITRYIDEKLDEVFKEVLEELRKTKNDPKYPNPILYLRKKWWEEKRNSVWDAMQYGVTNALKHIGATEQSYDKIECMKDDNNIRNFHIFATPQFVRWLEEWTHQFCEEYKKYIEEVEKNCNGGSTKNECNSGTGDCKNACTKYTNWINIKKTEWNGMSKYYTSIYHKDQYTSPDGTDYGDVHQETAIKHLNVKCKDDIDGTNKCCHCKNIGKENATASKSKSPTNDKPLEHMDLVVTLKDTRYKEYRGQCTDCQLQHIKEQITKINEKVQARQEAIKKQVAATTSGGGAAKPAPAKPAAVRPPAAAAAKPVATKPEVPRPQEPSGNHKAGGGQGAGPGQQPPPPPPPPASVSPQGTGSSVQTSKIYVNPDQAPAQINVTFDTTSTNTAAGAPDGAPSNTAAGSDPQGGGGAGGTGPGGKVAAVPGTGGTATPKPSWLDLLTKTVLPLAGTATNIGIQAADIGIELAKVTAQTVGKPIAEVTAEHVLKPAAEKVFEKIKDLTNPTSGPNSNPGSNGSNSDPDAQAPGPAPAQPQLVNSGSSAGTGSTGGNHVASGSSQSGVPGPVGAAGPTGQGGSPSLPVAQVPSAITTPNQGVKPRSTGGRSTRSPKPSAEPQFPSRELVNSALSSNVMWSVGLAFAGIAYMLLKKKPKIPVDIFRVLEIPQKDYNIPRYRSANKYVPYTKYRGKTYIYVGDQDTDDYIGDISSSDVTTSDSEVDELDINEIYGYGGGKHRTLIDIVLRPSTSPHGTTPSGTDIVETTIYSDDTIPGDTPASDIPRTSGTTNSDTTKPSVTHTHSDTTQTSDTPASDIPRTGDNMDIVDTTTYGDTTPPSGTDIVEPTTYSDNIYGAKFYYTNTRSTNYCGGKIHIYMMVGDI
ncbi:erythrocyte membrane protein 1, PfEMP1, putative [Plasmodium gaboni]|uniref:Erythrocyte membrane protein 1, PfEMP1, putative n=1 Tax=Plasmodium gaboni TaxID=647221 RepID=A0ABY0KWQ1_9APIC|nr:erythrocyte membrane protein 1, PfEMP1, putative [Plasmodium gaboni]